MRAEIVGGNLFLGKFRVKGGGGIKSMYSTE